jgi:hypothetical protein
MGPHDPRGNAMKFNETSAYSAHAAHCCSQASLTQDESIKKFWGDMADEWIALANAMSERDVHGKIIPPRQNAIAKPDAYAVLTLPMPAKTPRI